MTELHEAVGDNNPQEVVRLLEAGENVNAITYAGNTPLKIAVWNKRTKIISLLEEYGGKL